MAPTAAGRAMCCSHLGSINHTLFEGVKEFHMRRIAASLLLVLVAGGSPLLAQTLGNANIHGKVTDETGGALPGVSVTASSAALIERQLVAVSEPDGSYRFSELPIGDYQVAFELSGFQRHVREDLHLTAGFSAEINVSLKVGAVAETITVSGQNPVVDTTAAAPSVNLSAQLLTE